LAKCALLLATAIARYYRAQRALRGGVPTHSAQPWCVGKTCHLHGRLHWRLGMRPHGRFQMRNGPFRISDVRRQAQVVWPVHQRRRILVRWSGDGNQGSPGAVGTAESLEGTPDNSGCNKNIPCSMQPCSYDFQCEGGAWTWLGRPSNIQLRGAGRAGHRSTSVAGLCHERTSPGTLR
jgi:hypothetical protein